MIWKKSHLGHYYKLYNNGWNKIYVKSGEDGMILYFAPFMTERLMIENSLLHSNSIIYQSLFNFPFNVEVVSINTR
jgi:hypothetical protein